MPTVTEHLGATIAAGPGERLTGRDPATVVELLRAHGWVYFTGFSPTLEEYELFAGRFGRCATPRVIHYPPGGIALGFHAEDSYNPWRPDALWFLCLRAGSYGGAPTGVVDGVGLLAALDEEWRSFSLGNGLRFDREWRPEAWQHAVGGDRRAEVGAYLDALPGLSHTFRPDGTLATRYDTPLVVRTRAGDDSLSNTMLHAITDQDYYGMSVADGTPIPPAFLANVEEVALAQEIQLGWADGDLVVIDNHRLMHRRGEYRGNDRDLRVIHGEEFFGSVMPPAATPIEQAVKEMLQGEEDLR